MWFLHHVNLSSNHGASLGDPTFPGPQILFWHQLTVILQSLKSNCDASVVLLILHGFCITETFLGRVSYSIKKTRFCSLSPHVYFCIIMEFKSKYSHWVFPCFVPAVLVHFIFILFQTTTCSACSRRCGYPVLLSTFIGLEPHELPALHWVQLPPGTSVSIQTWLELQVLVCLVILRGYQTGH